MLYKVKLKQKSGFIGTMTANTLFGGFLTAYSTYMGKQNITEKEIQDIVLSDLFKGGILPIGVKDNATIYPKGEMPKTMNVTRTLIARDSSENNIVNTTQMTYYGNSVFYISTELLDIDTLTKIINLMLDLGLGKWRSVGNGRFSLISIEEVPIVKGEMERIALSNFIPENNGYGSIKETGYTFRDAMATNGRKQTKVCMLLTGTKVKNSENFIGKHIYDTMSDTYIHGKSILIGE